MGILQSVSGKEIRIHLSDDAYLGKLLAMDERLTDATVKEAKSSQSIIAMIEALNLDMLHTNLSPMAIIITKSTPKTVILLSSIYPATPICSTDVRTFKPV